VTPDFYDENQKGYFRDYQFFLRTVKEHPQSRYPGQPWTFWQYSGTGSIPGIKGNADLNVFIGSPTQWKSWLARH
jgi:lysozyme